MRIRLTNHCSLNEWQSKWYLSGNHAEFLSYVRFVFELFESISISVQLKIFTFLYNQF